MAAKIIPQSVHRIFQYNAETGDITHAGSEKSAVYRYSGGHLGVWINGSNYFAHRVAWKLFYNQEPPEIIDHINRVPSDNRIKNLRSVTKSQNAINRKARTSLGISGVHRQRDNWRSRIRIDGTLQSLYYGPDFFEACCSRKSAEARFWHQT